MIEVKNISKRYGNKKVLENINFSANKGEILGLLGPNGAGKSTTMNIITGYIATNSGSVNINGHDISKEPIKAKFSLGYLPENPPLYQDMTVKAYLNFIFELKKVTIKSNGAKQSKNNKAAHIEEVCKLVKIDTVYNRLIKNLSKGYKQRIGLAAALLGYPTLLILDEPTVGLDPKQIIEIRTLINKLKSKHTIILSSHILSEVQMICDRIIVINDGKIVADNRTEDLSEQFLNSDEFIAEIKGDNQKVLSLLSSIDGIIEALNKSQKDADVFEYLIKVQKGIDVRQNIFKELSSINCPLLAMQPLKANLEDVFLKLTENIPVLENTPSAESSAKAIFSEIVESENLEDEPNEDVKADESENDEKGGQK